MTYTDQLNRIFAERLGRPNGINARFAWMYAPDVPYNQKTPTGFERKTWGARLGKRWMLCQWRPPDLTREQWATSFGVSFPYPDKGQYIAHAETALPFGKEPDVELTVEYCHTLRQQMETTYADHLAQSEAASKYYQDMYDKQRDDFTADCEPLSWKVGSPETPCDRGGCISWGGVKDVELAPIATA